MSKLCLIPIMFCFAECGFSSTKDDIDEARKLLPASYIDVVSGKDTVVIEVHGYFIINEFAKPVHNDSNVTIFTIKHKHQ